MIFVTSLKISSSVTLLLEVRGVSLWRRSAYYPQALIDRVQENSLDGYWVIGHVCISLL